MTSITKESCLFMNAHLFNEPPPGVGSVRLPTMSRPLCAKLAAAKFNCLINNDKNYGMPLAVLHAS
jgi:hypothetical protein